MSASGRPVFAAGTRVVHRGPDPLAPVRYGTVSGGPGPAGLTAVLLDGEPLPSVVDTRTLRPLRVDALELRLDGIGDVLDVPEVRRHLRALWEAEAERAGLAIAAVHAIGDDPTGHGRTGHGRTGHGRTGHGVSAAGKQTGADSVVLAEVVADGQSWSLDAFRTPDGALVLGANHMTRWAW